MKRLDLNDRVQYHASPNPSPAPFRRLAQFANMPLLDNELMNPGWYNIIFPGNSFNNHRLWIKIIDL